MERRFGDALIPALFGCQVSFEDASGHPFAVALNLTDDQVDDLAPPDVVHQRLTGLLLPEHPVAGWRTTGEPGFEGVINIAYKLRGQDLFLDMIEAPARARHLFDAIWHTINEFVHLVRAWQDASASRPTHFVNCNCLVNMMSSRMYRQQLLEFDRRFLSSFELFGIHTCNWRIDPYLQALVDLPGLAYLDMGEQSDLDRVHDLFPNLRPAVFVHPKRFQAMSEQEIARHITELGRRIGQGHILLSDLEAGTRDSQIRTAYEAAVRL
jgi:hypothetical protein